MNRYGANVWGRRAILPEMAAKRGGYKFVTEPSPTLKCLICLEVAEDPRQETCGKLFCKECTEKNGNNPCPNCRNRKPQYFPDRKSDREIKELRVKCENVEKGCGWEGTIRTLEDHATTCPFTPVPCPNKCKVAGQVLKMINKDLDQHLKTKCPNRHYRCPHCEKEGTFSSISEVHDGVCTKKVVPCPKPGCTSTMERGLVSAHIKTVCEYMEVPCRYENIGCRTKIFRKDIRQHENDANNHFPFVMKKLVEMESTMTENVSSIGRSISSLRDAMTIKSGITFRLSDYAKKKRRNKTFWSRPFYTSSSGYKIIILVYANGRGNGRGTHVSIFSKLLRGSYNRELAWPFVGTVTFELLNQLEDTNHCSKVVPYRQVMNARVGNIWGCPDFILHSWLSLADRNTQYLKDDDTLYFRVTVQVAKPWLATGTM